MTRDLRRLEPPLGPLLKQHFDEQALETCLELGRLSELLGDPTGATLDDETRRRAAEHRMACEACRLAYEIAVELADGEPQAPATDGAASSSARLVPLRPRPRRRDAALTRWLAIAAALMLIGATSLIVDRTQSGPRLGEGEPGAALLPKGGTAASAGGEAAQETERLEVAIARDGLRFAASPHDRVETGDRLGLFYHATRPGHLLVVGLDAEGTMAVLHPAEGAASGPIEPGHQVPLPSGAIVGDGQRCEWIVAVFSDAAIQARLVEDLLRSAERPSDSECSLSTPTIEGARSVSIFPLRR